MGKFESKIGRLGEDIACKYLWCNSYEIRERNVYFRDGEIDIVAEKYGILYLVEVRTKVSTKYQPEDSLSKTKINQILKTAEEYCYSVGYQGKYEIQFIAIELGRNMGVKRLFHYTDLTL